MSHWVWLAGSYNSEGTQTRVSPLWVHLPCLETSVPHEQPCFYLCLETESLLAVQTLKSLVAFFSVLVNGVANFVNWRPFMRIDRQELTLLLIAHYLPGRHVLFTDQSQSFILPPGPLMTTVACHC